MRFRRPAWSDGAGASDQRIGERTRGRRQWLSRSLAIALTTSSDRFVHYNIAQRADTLMTIPITGWVASMATLNLPRILMRWRRHGCFVQRLHCGCRPKGARCWPHHAHSMNDLSLRKELRWP